MSSFPPELRETFAQVIAEYRTFLIREGWPERCLFTQTTNLITTLPGAGIVFRPHAFMSPEQVETLFNQARARGYAVELYAVGVLDSTSITLFRTIYDLRVDEAMFVQGGVKLSLATRRANLIPVNAAWLWRCLRRRRYIRRRQIRGSLRPGSKSTGAA